MDINQYLERINYAGPLNPTFEVLSKLQLMHLMNVPFENLDIHNKIKIDILELSECQASFGKCTGTTVT